MLAAYMSLFQTSATGDIAAACAVIITSLAAEFRRWPKLIPRTCMRQGNAKPTCREPKDLSEVDVVEPDGRPEAAHLGDARADAVRSRAHLCREQLTCGDTANCRPCQLPSDLAKLHEWCVRVCLQRPHYPGRHLVPLPAVCCYSLAGTYGRICASHYNSILHSTRNADEQCLILAVVIACRVQSTGCNSDKNSLVRHQFITCLAVCIDG